MVKRISSGSELEVIAGYSRVIVDDRMVYVAGTTGMEYKTGFLSQDVGEQTHQCFRNIKSALEEAGASLEDVVRVQYTLTKRDYFEEVAPIWGMYFAETRPAATCVIAGLVDDRMKIEIEVTARIGASEPDAVFHSDFRVLF